MKSDYHIHSDFSVDSKIPMEAYCEQAILIGLEEICFTDHVDYDIVNQYTESQTVDYRAFFDSIETMRQKYEGRLIIKAGMEFGPQLHNLDRYALDAKSHPFDFILLSSHEIDNKEFWLYQYQEGKTQIEYNRGYYTNLLEIVKSFDGFSVIGHLDVIKRYDKAGVLDDEICIDLIRELLVEVIRKGKGIELNTSSFRYGMNDLMPSSTILKLYKELGGRIITIGSDAHNLANLGEHMDLVKEKLKELGFEEFCTFDQMNPVFHSL